VHGIAGLERNITEKAVSYQPSALSEKLESTEELSEKNPEDVMEKTLNRQRRH
jgi:hypothetical protein